MGLYQASTGDLLTADRWNTIYNLLKGVAGGEDTIRLANNVAGTLLLQPTSAPAAPVDLFQVKTAAGVEQFAVRSDGVLVLLKRAAPPGSLEEGALWLQSDAPYAYLNETAWALSLRPLTRRIRLPATEFLASWGSPSLGTTYNIISWAFDPSSVEAIMANWETPVDWLSGTITVKLRYGCIVSGSGNVVWKLEYKAVSENDESLTMALSTPQYVTSSIPDPAYDRWKEETVGTMTVASGEELIIVISRQADHANDTYNADAHLLAVVLEYTPNN